MSAQASQQIRDENGFITIERNPISRVGVFPYLGKNISTECEPERVYNVYRPAEELTDPAAMASFELVPLVNDHTMLGSGFTAAENKGVQGTTGENLTFEDGVLYAPIKIFSETLKNLIASGKKALSLGYRVREWEKKAGTWNGQAYDFIQRGMRGNHLALVDAARCNVAILDHSFAFDSFDLNVADDLKSGSSQETISENIKTEVEAGKSQKQAVAIAEHKAKDNKGAKDMADEAKTEEKKEMNMDDVKAFMKEHMKDRKSFDKLMDEMRPDEEAGETKVEDEDTKEKAGEAKDAEEEKAKDEAEEKEKAKDEAEEKKKDKEAMDSINKRLAAMDALEKRLAVVEGRGTKEMLADIANRDKLVAKVTPHIGTFDHSLMAGADEVAAYALEKMGKKAPKGQESIVLDAYLDGIAAAKPRIGIALDSKKSTSGGDLIAKTLADSQ